MNTFARTLRRPPRTVLGRVAGLAAALSLLCAPGAMADVLTVDDDKAECPSADFTSVITATASAAQGDTIVVCAGTYTVPGGAGSAGWKIEKNLTIKGEGADKVFIQPDAGAGPSIATATPNERDEFGNVITVKRRTVELSSVSISGLTVQGNGVGVEAGIAMIDVIQGSITGVRVRDLVPVTGPGTGPYTGLLAGHGHGVVVANTLVASINAVTVSGNDISGYNKSGIVIDGRNLAGTAPIGIGASTVTVSQNRITGAGPGQAIGQNGIEVWADMRGQISSNLITLNDNPAPTEGGSAGVLLRGAAATSTIGTNNNFVGNAYGVYNGLFDGSVNANANLAANSNWWGAVGGPTIGLPKVTTDPISGSSSVAAGTPRTTPATINPFAPLATNTAPTIVLDEPVDPTTAKPSVAVPLGAVAEDDFGVKQVEFKVDGTSVAVDPVFPYTGEWTPAESDDGTTKTITAEVTDSAGVTTTAATSAAVTVASDPPTVALTAPVASTTAKPGDLVPLAAEADDDIAVAGVEFFVDGVSVGVDSTAPYTGEFTPSSTGTKTITAEATDSGGHTAVSAPVAVVVKSAVVAPPVVPVIPKPFTPLSPVPSLRARVSGASKTRKGSPRVATTLAGAGKVAMTFTVRRRIKVKGKTKTVTVKIGTAAMSFAGAGTKIVRVKLTKTGRAILKARGKLRVTATVYTTVAGTTVKSTPKVTLTAKKAAKKK